MNYSFPKLLETLAAGGEGGERRLVLATIVWTDGSTPQTVGASAVFSREGLVAGTVGGGALEARVEAAAKQALADGEARLVSIRLDADPSDLEGAVCGGAVRVLVDPGVGAAKDVFESAIEGLKKRRGGVLVSRIAAGPEGRAAVERGFLAAGAPVGPGDPLFGGLAPEGLKGALAGGRPRLFGEGSDRLIFVEPVLPLPRLVIAGAGHVGRAVARLGKLLDFVVTVIDDRLEFANAANVPEADEIVAGEIGRALREVEDAPDNYFIIVTRGHQKDAEALRAVIGREAAYIGMIGSKIKVGLMRRGFLESGWATEEEWARVHAPIGLEIGSKTVEEIAVSIAAELVKVRSEMKDAGPGAP
jgi:xanthine dehydrogenase accessory factor